MNIIVLGNIICFIGALLMVGIGFIKQRRNILIAQSFQFGILGIGNFILGGMSGFISNTLGIIRNLFCLKYRLHILMACGFLAVQAIITWKVNNMGLVGWLPFIATFLFTFSINSKDEIILKLISIIGLICWGIYDMTIYNYASFIFDVFAVISNTCGIISIRKVRKK